MPKLVSGRVVNTRIDGPSSATLPSASQMGMSNSAPSERPIQLRCWADDALGPVDEVEVVEELLRVVGDAEEPLLEVASLDQVAGSFAATVDDLLVGEHGLATGAPVHRRHGPVRQAGLEQPEEDPLRPADVVGIVAVQLTTPVVDAADPHQRALQLLDPVVGETSGDGRRS